MPHLSRPTPERPATNPGAAQIPPGGLPASACQRRPCDRFLHPDSGPCLWAQLAGIVVIHVWNYAASSRFVWNSPKTTWLPIALGSLLRVVQIWMPVVGVHSWQQATLQPWQGISARQAHLSGCLRSIGAVQVQALWNRNFPSPLSGEPAVQPDGRTGMARPRAVGTLQRTDHLAGNAARPALVHPKVGWWAGLAFALSPLGVYYGRAFKQKPCWFCAGIPRSPQHLC